MFYRKKEYERMSDALKAIELIDFTKYQPCIVTVCLFIDDQSIAEQDVEVLTVK